MRQAFYFFYYKQILVKLLCHRETNSITRGCGYVGIYHVCDLAINGTIIIELYYDDCKICQ